MARLYAISDLHLAHPLNASAWDLLRPKPPGAGLILAGDIGESATHLIKAFERAKACFTHVFWVPGNHELYSVSPAVAKHPADRLRGEAKYNALVELARQHGVLTPEDDWMLWRQPDGVDVVVALVFTLYDYSFRPADISREQALEWAMEENVWATDEALLHPDPYSSRDEWCTKLCDRWELKFAEYARRYPNVKFVIVNHWPLREDLIFIPKIPRFTLWCGTKRTRNWAEGGHFGADYGGAEVVVTGHLHVRRTDIKEGVRYEEVSLGYPRQWEKARDADKGPNELLRQILPGDALVEEGQRIWRPQG
ncbi:uncharacterized protein TRIREDRAFT_121500 [Trichoderma reesei QM6a]|jgi:predicted phosphodiesterase|uniref:Predicted protein n=2 Tax=Hypocrea jecorina TaxID=51453 RepID=G0RHB9_HYPJQ|nr:uncharacterized protein TRIREDRAFT_121500 [Trichoderma reesei QM6a]EGR49682.1 predicted protein [Trichoderma reesei QM6a]ETS02702.1 hypothetical protein M419DRAFT_24446 [Trichoderma reesei RUT C-30]